VQEGELTSFSVGMTSQHQHLQRLKNFDYVNQMFIQLKDVHLLALDVESTKSCPDNSGFPLLSHTFRIHHELQLLPMSGKYQLILKKSNYSKRNEQKKYQISPVPGVSVFQHLLRILEGRTAPNFPSYRSLPMTPSKRELDWLFELLEACFRQDSMDGITLSRRQMYLMVTKEEKM
jgi:hypothetical protein